MDRVMGCYVVVFPRRIKVKLQVRPAQRQLRGAAHESLLRRDAAARLYRLAVLTRHLLKFVIVDGRRAS
jgi:hypothetical protein